MLSAFMLSSNLSARTYVKDKLKEVHFVCFLQKIKSEKYVVHFHSAQPSQ